MRLTVRLFAWARELVGRDALEIELPDGSTVGDVRAALQDRCPELGMEREAVRIAVDEEFVAGDRIVVEGDDLAVIPPVSGG